MSQVSNRWRVKGLENCLLHHEMTHNGRSSTLWLPPAAHETNKALDVGSWVWEAVREVTAAGPKSSPCSESDMRGYNTRLFQVVSYEETGLLIKQLLRLSKVVYGTTYNEEVTPMCKANQKALN